MSIFGKKSKKMAKTLDVKFTVSDGLTPTRSGPARVINLRCPLELKLPPMSDVRVSLGLVCDHPVVVFAPLGLTNRKVTFVQQNYIFDANQEIVIKLTNSSLTREVVEEGEVVAKAIILSNSIVELV